MSSEPPVGVIGIGLMGEVFARRLVSAGFSVVGFDIDPAKTARLSELGARPAASIAEVARAANPIVLAVFNTDQVEEVVETGDPSGASAGMDASRARSSCAPAPAIPTGWRRWRSA